MFEDADLDIAIKSLMASKFRNAGQACIASNRVMVHESVYEEFVDRVKTAVSSLKCGSGFDKDVNIGPLINKKARDKVRLYSLVVL